MNKSQLAIASAMAASFEVGCSVLRGPLRVSGGM
jgi:hypothetical protein